MNSTLYWNSVPRSDGKNDQNNWFPRQNPRSFSSAEQRIRPNKSTNDELECDTSEDCQMAKKRKRKYSRAAGTEVKREMHRYKRGKAKSGKGGKAGKVKSRKQAIAIALSKARKKGKKVPKKK